MGEKFRFKIKMPKIAMKKIKRELKRLETMPVPQNPGIPVQAMPIPDQAMPFPVVSGGEVEYSRDDICKLAANGANIYAGEPEGGQKSGPGK